MKKKEIIEQSGLKFRHYFVCKYCDKELRITHEVERDVCRDCSFFRCKGCEKEFRTTEHSRKGYCRTCSGMATDLAIIARCLTCDFPIGRGEAFYRSSIGTYSGTSTTVGGSQDMGGGFSATGSYSQHQGETQSDQGVQCEWCILEHNKEVAIRAILYNSYYGGREGIKGLNWIGRIKGASGGFVLLSFVFIAFLVSILFGPILFGFLKLIGVAERPYVNRYQFRNYRPGKMIEECHGCEIVIRREKDQQNSGESVNLGGYRNFPKHKELRPICKPCGKTHEEK